MKAKFHLPDFTVNFNVNYFLIEMMEVYPEYFRDDVEIGSVYGVFPPAIWNGGRVRKGGCSRSFMENVIGALNEKGIPLRFTFTNLLLTEEHLKDELCNDIMKMADNGLNEVIVASPLLEDYIRETYPNYKITSSTCKRLDDPALAAAELEKDYSLVVLDYDLNNRFDVLEKLPHKEKCELLVNACCNPECKCRSEHYEVISATQIAYGDFVKRNGGNRAAKFDFTQYPQYSKYFTSASDNCQCELRTLFQIKELRTHITPEDIREKYMPMGFCNFKLEGRSLELLNIIEQYMYYLVKPECVDEARFRFLCKLANEGIIRLPYHLI